MLLFSFVRGDKVFPIDNLICFGVAEIVSDRRTSRHKLRTFRGFFSERDVYPRHLLMIVYLLCKGVK